MRVSPRIISDYVARCEQYYSALVQVLREQIQPGDIVAVAVFPDALAYPERLKNRYAPAFRQQQPNSTNWLVQAIDSGASDRTIAVRAIDEYVALLDDFYKSIQSVGASLILLTDTPALSPVSANVSQQDCLDFSMESRGECMNIDVPTTRACATIWPNPDWYWQEMIRQRNKNFAQSHSRVFLFDEAGRMCDTGRCTGYIPGTDRKAYLDDDHISNEASGFLWPFLCSFLEDNALVRNSVSSPTVSPATVCRRCMYTSPRSRNMLFASLPCCDVEA